MWQPFVARTSKPTNLPQEGIDLLSAPSAAVAIHRFFSRQSNSDAASPLKHRAGTLSWRDLPGGSEEQSVGGGYFWRCFVHSALITYQRQ